MKTYWGILLFIPIFVPFPAIDIEMNELCKFTEGLRGGVAMSKLDKGLQRFLPSSYMGEKI